jgi:hypothetical protein
LCPQDTNVLPSISIKSDDISLQITSIQVTCYSCLVKIYNTPWKWKREELGFWDNLNHCSIATFSNLSQPMLYSSPPLIRLPLMPSWLWLHGSLIYNYLCSQWLSSLTWVWIPLKVRCTRYNIMWSSLSVTCCRSVVYSGTLFSSTNKTDCYNITEILLKVALHTIAIILILQNLFICKTTKFKHNWYKYRV